MDDKIEFTGSLKRRDFFIILFILLMIFSSVFTVGYIVRSLEDTKNVLNALGWWKIQRDCSQCDAWTCQATTQSLMPYNISGLNTNV